MLVANFPEDGDLFLAEHPVLLSSCPEWSRLAGIEPLLSPYKREVLPLNEIGMKRVSWVRLVSARELLQTNIAFADDNHVMG